MIGRKDKIVKQFTGGIAALFKANKITAFYGFGQLQPGNVVKVKQHDGSEVELKGTNVIIAAGSDSIELPFAKFDGEHIVDNVGALDFETDPEAPRRRRCRCRCRSGRRSPRCSGCIRRAVRGHWQGSNGSIDSSHLRGTRSDSAPRVVLSQVARGGGRWTVRVLLEGICDGSLDSAQCQRRDVDLPLIGVAREGDLHGVQPAAEVAGEGVAPGQAVGPVERVSGEREADPGGVDADLVRRPVVIWPCRRSSSRGRRKVSTVWARRGAEDREVALAVRPQVPTPSDPLAARSPPRTECPWETAQSAGGRPSLQARAAPPPAQPVAGLLIFYRFTAWPTYSM